MLRIIVIREIICMVRESAKLSKLNLRLLYILCWRINIFLNIFSSRTFLKVSPMYTCVYANKRSTSNCTLNKCMCPSQWSLRSYIPWMGFFFRIIPTYIHKYMNVFPEDATFWHWRRWQIQRIQCIALILLVDWKYYLGLGITSNNNNNNNWKKVLPLSCFLIYFYYFLEIQIFFNKWRLFAV